MIALVCSWTVRAGMILGVEDERHRRTYSINSAEWAKPEDRMPLFLARSHEATAHATALQLFAANGREPNWVTIEFVWV